MKPNGLLNRFTKEGLPNRWIAPVCFRAGERMMKFGWAVLLLLAGVAVPCESHAQSSASLYAEFSTSRFHNLIADNYLSGGTVGIVFDAYKYKRLLIGGDVQGRFLAGSGESYNGISVGPRVGLPLHVFRLTPYGEFLVGFARFNGNAQTAIYNGTGGNQSTDGEIQLNVGVTKQLSSRWDAMVDYSYSQYYAYGGQYNPKTFSAGAVYHFANR